MNFDLLKTFTTIDDKNIAYHVINDQISVDENRKALAKKYDFDLASLKYMDQIHSNIVQIPSKDISKYIADALVTDLINTPLLVMVADCIPILFYDDILGVIGVAHAGRNGTYQDIVTNVCEIMKNDFSCDLSNVKVELGPSIQKCCYEVSPELATIATKNFGNDIANGRFIDLQQINKKQLLKNGILEENITISKICTKCSNRNYFSYRRDPHCGRFGGLIMLRPKLEL